LKNNACGRYGSNKTENQQYAQQLTLQAIRFDVAKVGERDETTHVFAATYVVVYSRFKIYQDSLTFQSFVLSITPIDDLHLLK
jgi:hypothetical protein